MMLPFTKRVLARVACLFALQAAFFAIVQDSAAQISGGFGGGGFSNGSFTSTRAGHLPPSKSIVIEEFFNFHRHDIRLPRSGESIALELRWGCSIATSDQRTHFLQVGLATPRDIDLNDAKPINVCFVIDCSGSMSGDRIENVKKGLLSAVELLRDFDTFSVVTFGNDAKTVIEPQRPRNLRLIRQAIEGIRVSGSTNMHAGLMEGLNLVRKNLDSHDNNRLILLTDGHANEGVTEAEEIIADSKPYLSQEIDIATIGVGSDFNFELMRKLARSGRGLLHFVADDDDIEKVFVDELDGLLSSAVTDLQLQLQFENGLFVEHIYGYSPIIDRDSIRFDLDPIRAGTTQVILLRCRVSDSVARAGTLRARATLDYHDVDADSPNSIEAESALRYRPFDFRRVNPLSDQSVRRNVSIAVLADAIKNMAILWEQRKYDEAEALVRERIEQVNSRYPMALDEEVRRVRDIALDYLGK